MRNAINLALAFLTLIIPVSALADITGTVTLGTGQELNLNNGTVVSSGGDIQWTGNAIDFLGKAIGLDTTATAAFLYITYNQVITEENLQDMTAAPIPASALATFPIFLVETNGGNFASLLVTALSGTSITLEFDTFGVTAPSGPQISAVLNNYGLIPPGFPNSGIAQGSLFIIKGSGLASATSVSQLESSAAPGLPTTLNGATVSVTVNGTTVNPPFYYAEASQLALVMPSNTPLGAGIVTVTYNGQTSAEFSIQVVASGFGFLSSDQTGAGLALAFNTTNGATYGYANAVPPNTVIELYGSGLGADPTRDNTFSQTTNFPFSINGLAAIYIGGIPATIEYQGASGYPGVNQINVLIPANAPTGCFIGLVGVTSQGIPTNTLTLPIGSGTCDDPGLGYSGSTLNQLSALGTVNTGFVELLYSVSSQGGSSSTPTTFTGATAQFQSTTGAGYLGTADAIVSVGSCVALQTGANASTTTNGLSAGTITVTSPNAHQIVEGLAAVGSSYPGVYDVELPSGFVTTSGGTFSFSATAGTQVGAFTTQVVLPTPLLSWTNQSAGVTVTRSAGLPVTWTGGASGTLVVISGSSSTTSAAGSFTCLAPVDAQQFTVPSWILEALPASANGSVAVGNETIPQSFTATGLNFAYSVGFTSTTVNSVFQ